MDQDRRSPLLHEDWVYFDKPIRDFRGADWNVLEQQRSDYYQHLQVEQMLLLLKSMKQCPAFGYLISPYRHCLQSATKVYRAGFDNQTVVTALFHDVGFVVAPSTHGQYAATLLKPYISEENHWMLANHGDFQSYYYHDHPNVDNRNIRDRWKGHPHYDWAEEFVECFDQGAMDPNYDELPLSEFIPMVSEVVVITKTGVPVASDRKSS